MELHLRADTRIGPGQRFRVDGLLGAGGMGFVYKAFDDERGVRVALKVLKNVGEAALRRLKTEFRALADLSHPNLVQLYELFAAEGEIPFLTMELIDGVDLVRSVHRWPSTVVATADLSRSENVRPEPAAAGPPVATSVDDRGCFVDEVALRHRLRQLAWAVSALHANGKLHRDLKPSNILVTAAGRLVLLDFGLTADSDAVSAGFAGTPAYMAPEVIAGASPSEASDWYGVGVILYEALAGTAPFAGTPGQMLVQKRHPPALPANIEVAPDLAGLCLALMNQHPERRPRRSEVLNILGWPAPGSDPGRACGGKSPGGHPAEAEIFVGRAALLARLHGAFDAVAAGQAVLVRATGAAAIGKSTLVRRFLEELKQRAQPLLFAGACYEREWIRFKAFDGVVDQIIRWLRGQAGQGVSALVEAERPWLSLLFPAFLELAGDRPTIASGPDAQELRARSFRSFRTLLAGLAATAPLVIWIEDLQWADPDSLALLKALLDPPVPGMLVLFTERTDRDAGDDMGAVISTMMAEPISGLVVDDLGVGPLEDGDIQALALDLLTDAPRALRPRALALAEEAGGNPLFLIELVRFALAHAETLVGNERRLGLEEVVRARVAALPQPARDLLEMVALAGRPVTDSVAAEAADLADSWPRTSIELGLQRLVRVAGPHLLEAYHDRIREIVTGDLSVERRRRHHGRMARALERTGRADPEQLVEHYRAAGDLARAAQLAREAGARAAAALAFDRSAAFYRLALELRSLPPGEISAVEEARADALVGAGRGSEAAEVYLRAASGAEESRSRRLRAHAAEELLRAGHIDRATTAMQEVLRSMRIGFPSTPRRALVLVLVRSALLFVRGLGYRRRPLEQISARALDEIDITHSTALGLAMVEVVVSLAFQKLGLLLALRAGETFRVVRAIGTEVVASATAGRPRARATARLAARMERLREPDETPFITAGIPLARGMAAAFEERWADALELMTTAVAVFRERCAGVGWETSTAELFRLRALFMLGRVRELVQSFAPLLGESEARGNLYQATDLRLGTLNGFWLFDDDPSRAEQEVEAARAAWSRDHIHVQDFLALQALCNIDLYRGDPERAWARIEECWRPLERSSLFRVQLIRTQCHLLRARVALAVSSSVGAGRRQRLLLAVVRSAVPRLEREQVPSVTGQSLMLRAGLAARDGNRGRSTALLASAATLLEAEKLQLLAASAHFVLGVTGSGAVARDATRAAERYFADQPIRQPARLVAVFTPGLVT
jgi:hypothetical protein